MLHQWNRGRWDKVSVTRNNDNMSAILVCPGPSLANVDPHSLRGVGRTVYGINTSYPRVSPDYWMGLDKAACYDSRIWYESFPKLVRGNYTDMTVGSKLVRECPNTWFASLSPPPKGVSLFDMDEATDKLIWVKNTLAAMIHFIVFRGHRKIHLVGCDMGGDKDYYDDRVLTETQRRYNRMLYSSQIEYISSLAREASARGITIVSSTPGSPLNEHLGYVSLDDALAAAEDGVKVPLDAPVHCLDADRQSPPESPSVVMTSSDKPTLLHCNNFAILGGIETTILDIAKAMPEYRHVMATRATNSASLGFVDYVRAQGVEHVFAAPEDAARMYGPELVLLHNCHMFKNRLAGYKVLGAHHNNAGSFTPADHDWFVSEWVLRKYGLAAGRVIPPPVYTPDYTGIQRPRRNVPVVGRIQSATNATRGKTTPLYFDLLRRLRRCDLFVVGTAPSDIRSAPIKPGMMPAYLEEVDIFTIWGDTTETWSRVVTEANLSGIPVVARNHQDGLAEQLRKSGGGILVNTPEGFVENVQYLVDNPEEARRLGSRGRDWCLKNAGTDVFCSYLRKEVLGTR